MIEKLKEFFTEMVVYKDLKGSNFFSSISLPAFLRDWLLKMFEDENGKYDVEDVTEFVHTYLPKKDDWGAIRNRIMYHNEQVKILTKISVYININKEVTFSLPDYGLNNKETIIEPRVWAECEDDLARGSETWGVVTLGYREEDKASKLAPKIKLVEFKNFCPYVIDMDYFKDARASFSTEEWIDVILGAIDYNADGYRGDYATKNKMTMIARLLPFVEKRLNLIELAPKGTGKSYLFGHVSRFGLLTDGGRITRAKMFYEDNKGKGKGTPGFIVGPDYVAIDEVKLAKFKDENEMRSIMQGYMEYGTFNFGGYEGKSDAGIVFLGNIKTDNMDEYSNMFVELPTLFQESALLDRVHGFIKGWDAPRMNDDLKIKGWALNSEYFCTIMHLLRDDVSYRATVEQLIETPDGADTRDMEAIKRMATGFLKLLFPNVRKPSDISPKDFKQYCLRPAGKMRGIIIKQLGILDKEFAGKNAPTLTVRTPNEED